MLSKSVLRPFWALNIMADFSQWYLEFINANVASDSWKCGSENLLKKKVIPSRAARIMLSTQN